MGDEDEFYPKFFSMYGKEKKEKKIFTTTLSTQTFHYDAC